MITTLNAPTSPGLKLSSPRLIRIKELPHTRASMISIDQRSQGFLSGINIRQRLQVVLILFSKMQYKLCSEKNVAKLVVCVEGTAHSRQIAPVNFRGCNIHIIRGIYAIMTGCSLARGNGTDEIRGFLYQFPF